MAVIKKRDKYNLIERIADQKVISYDKASRIYADMSQKDRKRAIDDMQNDKKINLK